MAGLYVHVPFCAQACSYCDFHFTTRLGDRTAMAEAICLELASTLPDWGEQTFETLYFGGGTPSVLSAVDLERIAETAFRLGHWEMREWTLEANPEDLTDEALGRWLDMGVTRLSIGVQSFEPEVLSWMRRKHAPDDTKRAIVSASERGFAHLSIDLMYGLPVGSAGRWEADLEAACALPVDHLSCYILTAESRTLYGRQLEQGDLSAPSDERVVREYDLLRRCTAEAGFEHYEVSNFARPGGHSRHNSAYWDGIPYLGVGPGAHSFLHRSRWWNARSNAGYMKAAGDRDFETQRERETLSPVDRYNEALITGLRRLDGILPESIMQQTGIDPRLSEHLDALIRSGDCEWRGDRLRIPESRWPMGDAITLQLMA